MRYRVMNDEYHDRAHQTWKEDEAMEEEVQHMTQEQANSIKETRDDMLKMVDKLSKALLESSSLATGYGSLIGLPPAVAADRMSPMLDRLVILHGMIQAIGRDE